MVQMANRLYNAWYDGDHRYHRDDGPALVLCDGSQYWYRHGSWHRTDGPAIIDPSTGNSWYVNGIPITTDEQFQKIAKISDEELLMIIIKYGKIG